MTVGTGYVLETLREGAESTLYRGRQHGNILPLLAVALAAEQPSAPSEGPFTWSGTLSRRPEYWD
jgi:hypothetical protein